jgi:prophage regulatory protein
MRAKTPTPADVAARPAPIRFLRLPDVMSRTGLGRDAIYKLGREGKFPLRVKITEVATGWVESEVDAYLTARIALRDAAPARMASI